MTNDRVIDVRRGSRNVRWEVAALSYFVKSEYIFFEHGGRARTKTDYASNKSDYYPPYDSIVVFSAVYVAAVYSIRVYIYIYISLRARIVIFVRRPGVFVLSLPHLPSRVLRRGLFVFFFLLLFEVFRKPLVFIALSNTNKMCRRLPNHTLVKHRKNDLSYLSPVWLVEFIPFSCPGGIDGVTLLHARTLNSRVCVVHMFVCVYLHTKKIF